jgi:hypothetical protein
MSGKNHSSLCQQFEGIKERDIKCTAQWYMDERANKNEVANDIYFQLTDGPKFGIYQLAEVLLIFDHPVWQIGLIMENVFGAAFLHGKHDPVSPVITHIYRDQALIQAGKLSEIELL